MSMGKVRSYGSNEVSSGRRSPRINQDDSQCAFPQVFIQLSTRTLATSKTVISRNIDDIPKVWSPSFNISSLTRLRERDRNIKPQAKGSCLHFASKRLTNEAAICDVKH